MKITYLNDFTKFKSKDLTLALGYFDGVHLGHIDVLNQAIKLAKESNTLSSVCTFNMSVYDYINNNIQTDLTSLDEKISIFESMGFDEAIIIELSKDFIKLSKDEFIDIFLKDMRNIVVGFDYSFGYLGQGNTDYLKEKLKDKVYVVECIKYLNTKVGSQRIKEYLRNGDILNANALLNRTYKIDCMISKINSNYSLISNSKLFPKNGDYLLEIKIDDKNYMFNGKIKKNKNGNNYILKTQDEEFKKHKFLKQKYYSIYFKERLSNIF